jgi:hypothetical protein
VGSCAEVLVLRGLPVLLRRVVWVLATCRYTPDTPATCMHDQAAAVSL